MKLIVGLGNPGKEYEGTRHNAGFFALDKVCDWLSTKGEKVDFKLEKKFEAEVAKVKLGKEDIVLAKPQTFMNNSGISVRKIVDFYKLKPASDLIVVYDDMDIEIGKVRLRQSGSSAGHNGLQSIIDNLGSEGFIRVRIGIGRPEGSIKPEDYVLQKFNPEERELISKMVDDFIKNSLPYINFLN